MVVSNFIGEKKGALDAVRCAEIVTQLKEYAEVARYATDEIPVETVSLGDNQFRDMGGLGREDVQVFLPRVFPEIYSEICQLVFQGLDEYKRDVSTLTLTPLVCPTMKFQWTPVGGGFSVWHIEQASGTSSNRCLGWTLYLNDVEDGGETEFCYQQVKCKAETGKLILFPAGITHPHRGNPPYSSEKFIMTGWFEFAPAEIYSQAIEALRNQPNA